MAENEKVEAAAAEKKVGKPAKAKKDKPSLFSRIAAWFRSCRAELKKIVWTSPKAVRMNSLMVIIIVLISAAAVGIVDLIFSKFITILGMMI